MDSLLDVISKYGQVILPTNALELVEDRSNLHSRPESNAESQQHPVKYSSSNTPKQGDTARVDVTQFRKLVNDSAIDNRSGQHSVNGATRQVLSNSSSLSRVPVKMDTKASENTVWQNIGSQDSVTDINRVEKNDKHIEQNDTNLVSSLAKVNKHVPEGLPSSEDIMKWAAQSDASLMKSKISSSEVMGRRSGSPSNASDKMREVTMKSQKFATDFQGELILVDTFFLFVFSFCTSSTTCIIKLK